VWVRVGGIEGGRKRGTGGRSGGNEFGRTEWVRC